MVSLLCVFGLSNLRAASRVVAWGDNQYGQTNVPPDLTNAVQVAAGGFHSLALRLDGTVVGWGDNRYAQTNLPAGLSNVVRIACGWVHSLALRGDGSLVCWGDNQYGQSQVPAGLSNVVAIAAGGHNSMALRNDGTVVAWGDNYYGQTNVPQGLNNVVTISAGFFHSLALRADGTVAGWGMYCTDEYFYQIMGDDWWYPSRPVGLTNVVAIASASQDGYVLRGDATVSVWGDETFSGLSNVVAIAAGAYHHLALRRDGTVKAWGLDGSGQADEPSGLSNVVAVAGGGLHSIALVGDGPPLVTSLLPERLVAVGIGDVNFFASAVGGWPLSYQWQLDGANLPGATNAWLTLNSVLQSQSGIYSVLVSNAYGTSVSGGAKLTVAPANIVQPPQNQVVHLGGTATFTVQAQAAGPLKYQWRLNGADLLGETNGTLLVQNVSWGQQRSRYSVALSSDLGLVVSTAAELNVVNVAAWGDNYDTSAIFKGQATVFSDFTNIVAVAGGGYHSLALRNDGSVVAWGDDANGQTDVPKGLRNVVAVAAGYGHSLALRSNGTVAAWGLDNAGQVEVPSGLSNVVAIACGVNHSLALRADGSLISWGSQTNIPGLSDVTAITAGGYQNVALRRDGTVVAWGYVQNGVPYVPPGLSDVAAIACGDAHYVALLTDSRPAIWGDNSLGQTNAPQGLTNLLGVAAGDGHSLAVLAGGTVVSWGMNDFGQTNVPGDLRNVLTAACGSGHSLAIVGDSPPITRPLAANPFLTNGLFAVSLPTRCGRVYALEFKDSLNEAPWSFLPLVCGDGNLKIIIDPALPGVHRFYRVRQW